MRTLTAIMLATLVSCSTVEKSDPRVTQVIPLQYQDATRVVKIVAGDERMRSGMNELAADARTNSIIAQGSPEGVERIATRIRELDVR